MRKNTEFKFRLIRNLLVAVMLLASAHSTTAIAAGEEASRSDGIDDALQASVAIQRDPFWPVGFEPKRSVAVETTDQNVMVRVEKSADWNKAMEQIAIQGVSSKADSEFYAIINGQVKSMGETVTILVGEINYTWMIESISPPSSVKLRRLSAQ
jgi:hypothetical protein